MNNCTHPVSVMHMRDAQAAAKVLQSMIGPEASAVLAVHNKALLMMLLAWQGTRHLIQGVSEGTLKWNFRCPIVRELMLSLGLVDVSRRTLLKVVEHCGQFVIIKLHHTPPLTSEIRIS